MHNLRDVLRQAESDAVAVGHFNVSDLVFLKAVSAAACELRVPVVVGASKGERDFLGMCKLAVLVRMLRMEFDLPIFLNSDHTHSLQEAIKAARAGYDMISFDGSALPLEQNVKATRRAVEIIKSLHPDILVEGEIGDIGSGSQIHDYTDHPRRSYTTSAEAKQFVDATKVDMLAPAVGNMHGMLTTMVNGRTKKRLEIERISQIKRAVQIPLTLHGASGTHDEDLRKAIVAGINLVHINTELRLAWRRGLEEGLNDRPHEIVPYKLLPFAVNSVKRVVISRLRLFNNLPAVAATPA